MKKMIVCLLVLAMLGCESEDVQSDKASDASQAEEEPQSLVARNQAIADRAIQEYLEGTPYPVILEDGSDWMALEMGENPDRFLDRYGWFNGSFGGGYYFDANSKAHSKFFWEPWDGPIAGVVFQDLDSESAADVSTLESLNNVSLLGILNETEYGYLLWVCDDSEHFLHYGYK